MECVIVGAGISGLLCARELSTAGWRIRILERGRIGREASWAGGGILSPLYPWRQPEPIQRLCEWSQRHYPLLSESLGQDTGIDPEWRRCGMLWLALQDLGEARRWCDERGLQWEIPDRTRIERLQPGLQCSSGESHLWVDQIAQIRNPRLLKALGKDLSARGVTMLEHSPLVSWRRRGKRIISARIPGGEIKADLFLVTAGAWSSQLRAAGFWYPEIRPVKGQMLLFKANPGLLKMMVQRGEHYLIPRSDGRILAGSTVEEAGFDRRPTREAYQTLSRFALETLPELGCFPLELHWAGVRPASPAGIPYIGPHPQLENLYYDCGHFRNGVVMAPASARLLADLVVGRDPILDPSPYLPD